MSAAIVKKALEIVDPEFSENQGLKRKKRKNTSSSSLFPEKYTIGKATAIAASFNSHHQPSKKYSIEEARRDFSHKSRSEILKRNIEKLETIRKYSKVTLDDRSTNNIIERAVTGRPVEAKAKKSKKSTTVFTEEDFKKFEDEYLNSED